MAKRTSLNREISTPTQILVEGRTPEIFFREIVEHLNLKDKIQVRDYGSIDDLTSYMEVFVREQPFIERVIALGIIRDAEDNPAISAFQSVCSSLEAVDIEPPKRIGEIQTCTFRLPEIAGEIQERNIKIGVFILPDCNSRGMIETLCLNSLLEDVTSISTLKCIDDYFTCLTNNEGIKSKNSHKAKTWAYLSAHGDFDPLVGRAAQNGIWKWNNQAFQPLMKFLKILCGDELLNS